MPVPKRHLVARCPCCERPIWLKTLLALLGLTPFARRHSEVAFVVVTRGPGQGRGWKFERLLPTLADVAAHAGDQAAEQLRALARKALERMWFAGLLTHDDLARVAATVSYVRASGAPLPKLTFGTFAVEPNAPAAPPAPAVVHTERTPGRPVAGGTPTPRPHVAPPAPAPPPPPPPVPAPQAPAKHRNLSIGVWKP